MPDAAAAPDDLTAWIARLYRHPDLLRMGHNQSAEDLNLGLGWIYYGFARLLRPARAVVIGSRREELKRDPALQLLDLPLGTGLTLLRRRDDAAEEPLLSGRQHRVGRAPDEVSAAAG